MLRKFKNFYHLAQSYVAALIFNFPSKKLIVIGVTGTDGKSTTTNMIYHILKNCGQKVSMISSVNAQIGSHVYDTGFHVTTPSPWQMQKYLRKAADSGSVYFVLETTSHGLDQNRLANIHFKIAVITNITHEHLDYHKTWENYARTKARLFERVDFSILNKDDKSFEFLKKRAEGKIITYSLQDSSADFNLNSFPVTLNILGDYNYANALAAAASTSVLGCKKKTIQQALTKFKNLKGRMEEVDIGQDFTVFVDFAHTPNGLEQALKTLKSKIQHPKSKLIAVFGSAGLRDKIKRPLMGQIAAKYADVSVLTAEDPRTEKVEDICEEIANGLLENKKKERKDFYKIYDRKKAITFAISLAKKGDIVATFGKAHEKSMCFGKTEHPWDEFAAVKSALQKKLGNLK